MSSSSEAATTPETVRIIFTRCLRALPDQRGPIRRWCPLQRHQNPSPCRRSLQAASPYSSSCGGGRWTFRDGSGTVIGERREHRDPRGEEVAAPRAAEAAPARMRIIKARAGSSRLSASAASRSSRRLSSYADVSERSLAPPDPLPVPLPSPLPISMRPAAPAVLPITNIDAAAGGVLPQQVPAHLQNFYERARENVENMEMAREF